MKDVSDKINTLRVASACASITAAPETIKLVKEGIVPKGNVIETAKTAGILAAKKTSELVPFCHPVPLDYVNLEFELAAQEIIITSTVKAIWKTGVEMEALTSVTVAALTIYDMLKPLDKTLEIRSIKLLDKRGGKSDFHEEFTTPIKTAVIVISDSTYQGKRKDKSGQIILEKLKLQPVEVVKYEILPDDLEKIKTRLLDLCDKEGVDLVLTTGGTGLGPKDITVEATRSVLDREAPGLAETARMYGQNRTPYSMLSRGIAGTRGKSLIINLPGSSNGAKESMDCLFPAVLHAFKMIWGGGHKE